MATYIVIVCKLTCLFTIMTKQVQLPYQKIWFRAVGNGYVEEGGLKV